MNLKVQDFIQSHSDWEKILSEKPYCITISRDSVKGMDLVGLKYNQIESDFNIEIVRECRGLILDAHTFEAVTVPFFKFGNFSESYCPDINWNDCWVEQKIDGSLIKVVKTSDSEVLVSTNGTIDAFKAPLAEQLGCTAKSFGELVGEAFDNAGITTWAELAQLLDYNVTYMFELTSPFNQVVVQWNETSLHYLGSRDNDTLQEHHYLEHKVLSKLFDTPKMFKLNTLEQCVAAAKELGTDEEGFVVCDKNFNRVKVKSPIYVSLHAMSGNGVMSFERGLGIVMANECDEVLTYFPRFKKDLDEIKRLRDDYTAKLTSFKISLDTWKKSNGYDRAPWLIGAGGKERKNAAKFIFSIGKEYASFGFALLDSKTESVDAWLRDMPASKLADILNPKR